MDFSNSIVQEQHQREPMGQKPVHSTAEVERSSALIGNGTFKQSKSKRVNSGMSKSSKLSRNASECALYRDVYSELLMQSQDS